MSTVTKAYMVSAFCAFVVGLILCAQAGMGNMEAGNVYEMYGVAAGVIGGVSPLGGTGLLLGTFAGAAVWQTLENGLSMAGAPVAKRPPKRMRPHDAAAHEKRRTEPDATGNMAAAARPRCIDKQKF